MFWRKKCFKSQYGWKDARIKNVQEEKVFQTLEKGNSRNIE